MSSKRVPSSEKRVVGVKENETEIQRRYLEQLLSQYKAGSRDLPRIQCAAC
jgi:DNA-directed RNA polymerase subunit H (RpoH/RPB5)